MKKSLSMNVLADKWHNCTRCKLSESRNNSSIVFGYGNRRSKFLMIYDTPTFSDAEANTPFTGREGELLIELLNAAQIQVNDVYYTPMVGCWPAQLLPDTADKPARLVDREPEKEEVIACLPRVHEIIYRVDPVLIFAMGALPWKTLAKPGKAYNTIEKAVGEIFVANIPGRTVPEVPYMLIPLLSMKQLMASPSYAHHGPLATTARHMMKGAKYANWLAEQGRRDAEAAGLGQEAGH